ncbi:Ger(x)C family spore germination protein [Paenibacillus sp. S150]|uniref:Ger(x)C family spore germination protein n=1 Tax=Paenibacillus sp. S150 TaxID=2749826 RepID=UPI001C590720|nr:Ger(x)C family spore germination protein [Paenibacillus sp. S150]MBW4080797.1 Ger(x)C family spore germination protein [Paenibacillus sp. S150]
MKLFKLILSLLLLLNLTGCGSKIELDKLTFIFGLYIDAGAEPGTVEVSISSPLPNRLHSSIQAGSGGGISHSVMSKTAASITEAVILIQKDLSRRLEISHIKVVVLGKEYARQGIDEALDWFKRQPEIPLGTYVMMAPGKAKEITRLSAIYEQLPDQMLMNFSEENLMYATTVRDCLLAESSNMGYAMNYLSFGQKSEVAEDGKPAYWAGIQGVALFQNAKLRSTLPIKESRALAWAGGNLAGHLALPEYIVKWDEEGAGEATAMFLSNKSSISAELTEEGPVFYVKLKGNASITNFKDSRGRNSIDLSRVIKEKLQEAVVKDVSGSLRDSQKAGVDVLQLGMRVEWNYPGEWKKLRERWEDYYAHEAQIKVTAAFKIQDFGSSK